MHAATMTPLPLPLTIVVEDRLDVQVLRSLLSKSQSQAIRFFAGQGRMSVPSLARNILAFEGTFVLVVVDADGRDVAEVQSAISTLLGFIASPTQFEAFVFEPSLAAIMDEMGIGKNDTLSEEQKRRLRLHPQVDALLQRLIQLQPSNHGDATSRIVQPVAE